MLKKNHFLVLSLIAALSANPVFAAEKAAATVNGVSISETIVDLNLKAAKAKGREDSPELRKAIIDELVNREILSQAAMKDGLDKTPDVIQQLDFTRQSVLVAAYLQEQLKKNPVTDAQLQDEYNKIKAKLGDKEYKVSHILLKTEAEAREIIAKLGKKAKFEKLAKASEDTGSVEKGGDLGWHTPSTFVESFNDALLKLKKGEYTKDPVQTKFGWHVIKLDDVRPLKMPAFEELKPQLEQHMQQQFIQKMIGDMRATAKIE